MSADTRIRDVISRRPWMELVTHDVYRISDRVKRIDKGYTILRNTRTGNYEVHHSEQGENTLCLSSDRLDCTVLDRLEATLLNKDVLKIMDEHNAKIDKSRKRAELSEYDRAAREYYDNARFILDKKKSYVM